MAELSFYKTQEGVRGHRIALLGSSWRCQKAVNLQWTAVTLLFKQRVYFLNWCSSTHAWCNLKNCSPKTVRKYSLTAPMSSLMLFYFKLKDIPTFSIIIRCTLYLYALLLACQWTNLQLWYDHVSISECIPLWDTKFHHQAYNKINGTCCRM